MTARPLRSTSQESRFDAAEAHAFVVGPVLSISKGATKAA